MAQGSDLSLITEPLGLLLTAQAEQREILIHLEQREVPDMAGITRRLEEMTDALVRMQALPQRRPALSCGRTLLRIGVWVLVGYLLCWTTARWVPTWALPYGFTRPAAPLTTQKGKF